MSGILEMPGGTGVSQVPRPPGLQSAREVVSVWKGSRWTETSSGWRCECSGAATMERWVGRFGGRAETLTCGACGRRETMAEVVEKR